MAKFRETKIPIAEFLEAYRCQPCLYNSLLDTYKNRIAREEAYEAIISTLKIPQLTVLDIKLKIKSVRTVYTKELRILMRERELGRSYDPKLFWFKRADSFLRAVSLSHCKRLKNKQVHVDSSCTSSTSSTLATLNKEVPNNNSVLTNEDALHSTLEQKEEEVHHVTLCTVVQGGKRKMSIGTNTNPPPEAGCQTEDMPSNNSELMIEEANTLCMMEQQQEQQEQLMQQQQEQEQQQQEQQQQQQHQEQEQLHQHQQQTTMLRKLKYMAYPPSQSQSQLPHRQSTPFTSPSPSSQQLDMATSTSSVGPSYAGPGPNAPVVTSSAEDDLMIFGQSIASQLRTIPDPYSRSVAKLRIQQVLFEAETGQSSEAINPHLHSF